MIATAAMPIIALDCMRRRNWRQANSRSRTPRSPSAAARHERKWIQTSTPEKTSKAMPRRMVGDMGMIERRVGWAPPTKIARGDG